MITNNDYALSYNVKEKVLCILKSIYNFDTWTRASNFVNWFNKVIDAKGRVTIAEICNKMKKPSIEPFDRIGFNSCIKPEEIYELTRTDGSEFYQILFPILKDFTIKGVR